MFDLHESLKQSSSSRVYDFPLQRKLAFTEHFLLGLIIILNICFPVQSLWGYIINSLQIIYIFLITNDNCNKPLE